MRLWELGWSHMSEMLPVCWVSITTCFSTLRTTISPPALLCLV